MINVRVPPPIIMYLRLSDRFVIDMLCEIILSTVALPTVPVDDALPDGTLRLTDRVEGMPRSTCRVDGIAEPADTVGANESTGTDLVAFTVLMGLGSRSNLNSGPPGP